MLVGLSSDLAMIASEEILCSIGWVSEFESDRLDGAVECAVG